MPAGKGVAVYGVPLPERGGSRFGFRSGLCFADALLETVFTAVAAPIQFLGALSFLMTHDTLP